jgi:predicted nucleotidyltransferase
MGVAGGDKYREMAERTTVLRAPAGSTLPGLNLPGKGDSDEVGVCVEDIHAAMGFSEFEQYIYRSAAVREGQHDAPSQPGDLDLTMYSLRKFLRLALQGNPQIIQTLFVPEHLCIHRSELGAELQGLAPEIVSKKAGMRYLGYMESQRQKLLGERGQKRVNRPELEEKFGFDTKYMMHVLRLGFQGVELLSTGKLSFPMPEADRAFTYAVRLGEVPLQEALTKAGELERELKDLLDSSFIQDEPDYAFVQEWMIETYQISWSL